LNNYYTSRLKKNIEIPENPYSYKQKDLGFSVLNTNPINGKDYPPDVKYLGNPYMQGMNMNDDRRERLRIAGNNLMK